MKRQKKHYKDIIAALEIKLMQAVSAALDIA
jgi:hypothetical protein